MAPCLGYCTPFKLCSGYIIINFISSFLVAVAAIVFKWIVNSAEFCFSSLRWGDIVIFIFQVEQKDTGRLKCRGSTNFRHQRSLNYPCGKLIALAIAFMWPNANKASPAAITSMCWWGRLWSPELHPNADKHTIERWKLSCLSLLQSMDIWLPSSPSLPPIAVCDFVLCATESEDSTSSPGNQISGKLILWVNLGWFSQN